MSQTIQSDALAKIESVCRSLRPGAADDFRLLMRDIVIANLTAQAPGGNLIQIGGVKSGAAAAPVGVTHSVAGANGVATVNIANPPNTAPNTIWHEVSYSPLKSFTKGVTTQEPTQATSVTIPQSGVQAYYRLRSSFDKVNWSPYQFPQGGPVPVDAGLVESSAMAPGAAFNQTNFATVESPGSGTGALVSIHGPGGPFSSYTAIKGTTQSVRPAAVIVGNVQSFQSFIGWDGGQYQFKSSLAEVLADNLEPVGAVVIGSGVNGGGGANGGNGGRLTAI